MEMASHKYKKEVKDLTNELQEASSRLSEMQEQVRVTFLSWIIFVVPEA